MPILYGVITFPGLSAPQTIRIKLIKGRSVDDSIASVMKFTKCAPFIETDVGTLYTDTDPNPKLRNAVASSLLQNHCKNIPEESTNMYGRCFLLDRELSTTNKRDQKVKGKEKEKGLSKAETAANKIFFQLTGVNPETMTKHVGPARPKKPIDFFKTEFHAKERAEWEAKALESWNGLSDAEKQPFVEKAAEKSNKHKNVIQIYTTEFRKQGPNFEDREKMLRNKWNVNMTEQEKEPYNQLAIADNERYQQELTAFRVKNPQAPSLVKRGYYQYKEHHKDNPDAPAWNTLSDVQKAPFWALEAKDQLRYDEERRGYEQRCNELGIDCTRKEKRKRKAEPDQAGPSAPSAVPKRKPKAVSDGDKADKPAKRRKVEADPGSGAEKPKAKRAREPKAADAAAPKPQKKKAADGSPKKRKVAPATEPSVVAPAVAAV